LIWFKLLDATALVLRTVILFDGYFERLENIFFLSFTNYCCPDRNIYNYFAAGLLIFLILHSSE